MDTTAPTMDLPVIEKLREEELEEHFTRATPQHHDMAAAIFHYGRDEEPSKIAVSERESRPASTRPP